MLLVLILMWRFVLLAALFLLLGVDVGCSVGVVGGADVVDDAAALAADVACRVLLVVVWLRADAYWMLGVAVTGCGQLAVVVGSW